MTEENSFFILKIYVTHLKKSLSGGYSRYQNLRARGLFEVTAEVLGGIEKALRDFQEGEEVAWQKKQ